MIKYYGLLPHNSEVIPLVSLVEVLVPKAETVRLGQADLFEVVHVELPYKGVQVSMFEVLREYCAF